MRTTISISDAILRDLRSRARAKGRPFREVVEETLLLGLARQTRKGSRKRFTVKPHPLCLKPGLRGASPNQLYDQIEAEKDAQTP